VPDHRDPLWDTSDGLDELVLPDDPYLRGGMASEPSVQPAPSHLLAAGSPPENPRRTPAARVAVVLGAVVVLIVGGAGAIAAATTPTPTPPPAEPVVAYSSEWTPVDPSLSAGLVTVAVGPSIKAAGIVMTAEGLVATSYLATADATSLTVTMDGRTLDARIVGIDPSKDVAILTVPGMISPSVARPGDPAQKGDAVIVLDGGKPLQGAQVTIRKTGQYCVRGAGEAISHGLWLDLSEQRTDPGGAVVWPDGTLVGMYYGSDEGDTRCVVPVKYVQAVVDAVKKGKGSGSIEVLGPPK